MTLQAKSKSEAFEEIRAKLNAKLECTLKEYQQHQLSREERMKAGEIVWNYTSNINNRTSTFNQMKNHVENE